MTIEINDRSLTSPRISEALASLKWHQYVRSKQEIRAELKVILAKCKACFSNVGMGFNYHIGLFDFSSNSVLLGLQIILNY